MLQKAAVVSVEAVASTWEGSQISCSEQLSQRPAASAARQMHGHIRVAPLCLHLWPSCFKSHPPSEDTAASEQTKSRNIALALKAVSEAHLPSQE